MKDFSKKLIAWFLKNQRPLPWRTTRDPYKIWISEIMLQQTTVNAVIPYYMRWMRRFPDMITLSKAQEATVLKAWQGLGYYNRVRNLHRAAKIIVQQFRGRIPQQKDVLRQLPGFGPYTVGAVLSIAFGRREPIVDANVRRVVMRLKAMKGPAHPSQDQKIVEFLRGVLPQKNMSAFNQGLMELGALICRTQNTLCLQCPLRSFCSAYHKGLQEVIPEKAQKQIISKHVSLAIIRKKGKFFIQKRPSSGLLANFWEFPGGELEKNESAQEALEREVREETGATVVQARPLPQVKHFYTKFCVYLHPFLCDVAQPLKKDKTHQWVTLDEIKKYPVPSGTARVVDLLRQGAK